METNLIKINPRDIQLLALNARFMRHEKYKQLVANIKRDQKVTQIPFAWAVRDDDDPKHPMLLKEGGEINYAVLSGNHRVRASIDAGLAEIDLQVTDEYLTPEQRVAIQVSHNAISGEDDPVILRTLYQSIEDVELRVYTGLDDKQLGLLDAVTITPMNTPNLQFQNITLTFLPHEIDRVTATLEAARKAASNAKGTWIARWAEYDKCLDQLEAASQTHGIRNTATALMVILEVFEQHIDEIADGYLDELGEAVDPKRDVPPATALGATIPAALAAALRKFINKHEGDLLALLDLVDSANNKKR